MKLSGMNQVPDDRNYDVKSPACSAQLYTRFSCSPLISSSDLPLSVAQLDRIGGPGPLTSEPSVQSSTAAAAAASIIKSSLRIQYDNHQNCFSPSVGSGHLISSPVPQYVRTTSPVNQHNSHESVDCVATTTTSVSLVPSTPFTPTTTNTADIQLILNGSSNPNLSFGTYNTDCLTPSDLNGRSGSHTPASVSDPEQRIRMDMAKLDETIDYVLSCAISDEPFEGMFVLSCRQPLDTTHLSSPLLRVSTPSSSGPLVSPSPPSSPTSALHSSPLYNNINRSVLEMVTNTSEQYLTHTSPMSLVHFCPHPRTSQISSFGPPHSSLPLFSSHLSPTAATAAVPSGHHVHVVNNSTASSFFPTSPICHTLSSTKFNFVHNVSTIPISYGSRVTPLVSSQSPMSVNLTCDPNHPPSGLSLNSPPPTCSSCVLRTAPTSFPASSHIGSTNDLSSLPSVDQRTLLQQKQSICFRQPMNPAQSINLPPSDISNHTNTVTDIRPPPPIVPPDRSLHPSVTSHHTTSNTGSSAVRSVSTTVGLFRKRSHVSHASVSSKRRKSSVSSSCAVPSPSPSALMSTYLHTGVPPNLSQEVVNRVNSSLAQEYVDRLKLSDVRSLVSAPVLKPYSSVLLPMGASDTPLFLLPRSIEQPMLSRKNIKYARGTLSLRPPKCVFPETDKVDSYIFRNLSVSTPSGPILNDLKEINPSTRSICRSPEPATFENNMQTLFSTFRQFPKEERESDIMDNQCTLNNERLIEKMLPIFSSLSTSACDKPDPNRSTPPLQFFHMPNPNLICKPIPDNLPNRVKSSAVEPRSQLTCKLGLGSSGDVQKRESAKLSFDRPITFTISPPPRIDISIIVHQISQSLTVNRDTISYHLTPSHVRITLGASSQSQNLRYIEMRMRELFLSFHVEFEHDESDQLINGSSLTLLRSSLPDAKLCEDSLSVQNLSAKLSEGEQYCQNCDKPFSASNDVTVHRKCFSELTSSIVIPTRSDFGTTCVGDEFVFCSPECLQIFSHSFTSRLNTFDPSHHTSFVGGGMGTESIRTQPTANLVCDLPSAHPVFLQSCPPKLPKYKRPGCKRRGSASGPNNTVKTRRWRDIYWYEFTEDMLPTSSKISRTTSDRVSPAQSSQSDLSHLLASSLGDQRTCRLCELKGDGPEHGVGRLLPSDTNEWLHVNCALWCFNVYETVGGSLDNVAESVDRALETTCTHCFRLGAGLPCYNPRCSYIYHVPCALEIGCMFFTDRGMYCPQHQPREAHPMQLPSLVVDRRVYITRDENNQVGSVVHEEDRTGVVRIGSVCLHNVGQLLPHQLDSGYFHTRRFIYPVGFKSSRIYWSMRVPLHRSLYFCDIVESPAGRPLFRVTATDEGMDELVLEDETCTGVWHQILSKIAELRDERKLVKLFYQHLKGEEMYGLCEPHIMRAVESLPGVDCLRDYVFNFGRMELIAEMPLAINPSGCARCEPKMQTYVKRVNLGSSGSGLSAASGGVRGVPLPGLRRSTHPGLSVLPGNNGAFEFSKQYQSSRSQQYRRLKSEVSTNVILGRSRIQGLGLFAARDLEPQTMVIEYIGELIRLELANKREKEYEAYNRGIYMFRLNDDTVIDATMTGGLARYINHSCQSNCFAEFLNFGDRSHIVIITTRHIDKGEELCYDYNFDLEDGGDKIPCLCRAQNCRKWMN